MLKTIRPSDVELGMYIHKLEGSWFKHPFWKSKFLLEDPLVLRDLRECDIPGVVIDVSKGRDHQDLPQRQTLQSSAAAALGNRASLRAQPAKPQPFDFASTKRTDLSREFGHARTIANRSEKVVSRVFLQSRLGKAVDSAVVEPVISDIFASVQRNPHAFNGLMRCKRDNQYVFQHALAVSALMISLARQLKLSPEQLRNAGMAGLLLDVGIGHLPIDLAAAAGDYRDVNEEVLQAHTTLGYEYLRMGGDIPDDVALVALQHHERLDGSGYPQGLRGEAISLLSRMAAICDVYDALVTDRATHRGLDPGAAILKMQEASGQFDERLLDAFILAIGAHPVGSVVRLGSDRLALVIDQDPADHTLPRVRTFFSVRTGKMTRPEDINLAQCFGQDRIVAVVDPETYGIKDFSQLRLRIFTAACKASA